MRYVDPQRSISAVRLFNFDEIQRLKRFTWQDAVLAAWRLAESVAHLHRHGVVIGDLNPENIVFEQRQDTTGRSRWQATILDTDSFQLQGADGQRHYCPVSRPAYTAPELVGANLARTWRQTSADDFALAVIVYQLLLHDHPYDNAINTREPDLAVSSKIRRGLYPHAAVPALGLQPSPWRPAPNMVSEALDQAFRRSFCAAPSLRLSADEWVHLLQQLHGELVPCRNQRPHHHPAGKPCLWCAIEQKLGPLCSFPDNGRPPAGTAPPGTDIDHAKAAPAADLPAPLLAELKALLARGQRVLQRRGTLADRLLVLEHDLNSLIKRCADPAHWFDQEAVVTPLHALRGRISRWLGHDEKVRQRQQALEALQQWADAMASATITTVQGLELERTDLLQALSALRLQQLDDLINTADPTQAAQTLIMEAREQRRQQWLSQSLSQIPIRSWQIQGFGSARITMLESHGLIHGEHLRCHLDRLTALPGIGRGLQQTLQRHLQDVITTLEAQCTFNDTDLPMEALASTSQILQLQEVETSLAALDQAVDALEQRHRAVVQGLQQQRIERDRLIQSYAALFWFLP